MAFRRKRRNRGTWMPVNGHNVQGDLQTAGYADLRVDTPFVNIDNADGAVVSIYPIVPDFSLEQGAGSTQANAQLRDIVSGQAWRLNRIVGKLHISTAGVVGDEQSVWANIYVVAGFFIARSVDEAQAQVDLTLQEQNPQDRDNMMNPWIWRRSWILGNSLFAPSSPGIGPPVWFPNSNAEYNSVADGPHIDSKVKRFINREHRLWFVLSARGYASDTTQVTGSASQSVTGLLDYRIHGQLARQRNTSSF